MKYRYIIFIACILSSCSWAKQKAKDTVNKSGEVVAKAGSEFADGVKKGVEKTFENELVLSDDLKKKGLKTGRIYISQTDSATDNILTVYFIFDNDIDQNVMAKVFDENGQEYGRSSMLVKGQKGEARYMDFVFDKRTNIDSKGKVTLE